MKNQSDSNKPKSTRRQKNKLGYIDPTVAGIDIGSRLIHVAIPRHNAPPIVKEFGTTTPELQKIANELIKSGVQQAPMEATGVYWVPLFEILEEKGIQPILVDAKGVKNVPGRKTDVTDCQWIQTLYSNGLLRAAFRPEKKMIILREYVRQRRSLIKTHQQCLNRIEKTLQLMNIKLSTVVSDVGGVSGMAIIRAIGKGENNPARLARLRHSSCKKDQQHFIDALSGNFQNHHLFSLRQTLDHLDFIKKKIEECDELIKEELETLPDVEESPLSDHHKDKKKNPQYTALKKPRKHDPHFDVREILFRKSGIDITSLPGIQGNTALLVFAELGGFSMEKFESDKHFASWLKLCPGNNVSGGTRRKSRRQSCANPITQSLRMAAMSLKRSDSVIGAQIRRMSFREDKRHGIKAGAHKLARHLYYMCKFGRQYYEKGAAEYEKEQKERNLRILRKKARAMGFELTPEPIDAK